MLKDYDAVVHNGRIEWRGEAPPDTSKPLDVRVTVLGEAAELSPDERRRRMADALQRLAASNPFADIEDPVAWQREVRRDRPLPGRE
jgi:hypothetical protein